MRLTSIRFAAEPGKKPPKSQPVDGDKSKKRIVRQDSDDKKIPFIEDQELRQHDESWRNTKYGS